MYTARSGASNGDISNGRRKDEGALEYALSMMSKVKTRWRHFGGA